MMDSIKLRVIADGEATIEYVRKLTGLGDYAIALEKLELMLLAQFILEIRDLKQVMKDQYDIFRNAQVQFGEQT